MKKLLVGFFIASIMCVSTLASASTVTLVNKYNQPVQFTISQSSFYNPVWSGVIMGGDSVTVKMPGFITPDFQFMAFPPYETSIVSGCGHTFFAVKSVKIVAGYSSLTGTFGCGIVQKMYQH